MADRHNRDIDRPRAPLPEPLPVPTVDAHAHMEIVTDAAFDSQEVADVIAEAKSVNVDRIVQVGYSAEQSKWCVAAAEKWNTTVLAAVALHPNEAPVVADLEGDLSRLLKSLLSIHVFVQLVKPDLIISAHHPNYESASRIPSSGTSN